MARRKRRQRKTQPEPTIPWYKKVWFVISATAVVVSTVIINGPSLLENARKLPSEYSETSNQFKSWIYDDSGWTGNWSGHPEMYADIADMNLSDVDMKITLSSMGGFIDGTIATKEICKRVTIYNYVILTGEVDITGKSAVVIAWDIFQGQKVNFAKLRLNRDGEIMTVIPEEGMKDLFPQEARIAWDGPIEYDHSFCLEERKEIFKSLRNPHSPKE